MVFIVISQVFVLIETIESVLVRADPCPAFAIYEDARYTGFTDRVQRSQLIAHIVERRLGTGLHIDAFLQQAQPDITRLVFHNTVALALREIDFLTVVWIVFERSCLGVENGDALAVIAQ